MHPFSHYNALELKSFKVIDVIFDVPKTPQTWPRLRGCFFYIISKKLMTTASRSQMCGHIWVIEVIISMYRRCYQSGGGDMLPHTLTKRKIKGGFPNKEKLNNTILLIAPHLSPLRPASPPSRHFLPGLLRLSIRGQQKTVDMHPFSHYNALELKSYKAIYHVMITESPADVSASAGLLRLYRFNEAHDHGEQVADVWPHSGYCYHITDNRRCYQSGGGDMLPHTLTKRKIKGGFPNKRNTEKQSHFRLRATGVRRRYHETVHSAFRQII